MGKKKGVSPQVPADLGAALEIFMNNMKRLGKNTPPVNTDAFIIEPHPQGCKITPTSSQGIYEAKDCFVTLQKATRNQVTLTLKWTERSNASAFGGRRSSLAPAYKRKVFTSLKDLEKWISSEGRSVGRLRWSCVVS